MADPTNSGQRRLIFNFQERVVSDDWNRAQAFKAAALAELLRRQGAATTSSVTSGGKETAASAVSSPDRGVVISGLRFRPEIGTVNAFVEPGSLLVVHPEASPHPDDSPGRFINDPGKQAIDTGFQLSTAPGATRIDVVECSPYTLVTESDSRDIYNPATGLFSPAPVDKVFRGALAYRIRTGTPGAGFPGTASGWLPLAVCSVPAAAATWDDVAVWDVRPLLADLASPPHVEVAAFPRLRRALGQAFDDGAGHWQARGVFETEVDGWRVGGELAATSSGATYLDLQSAGVKEAGFAAAPGLAYLYLLLPFGLPRWCRLNPSTSGNRDPGALRGVPVFSTRPPAGLSGRLGSAAALPTGTGLGSSSSAGTAVLGALFNAGSALLNATVGDDGWCLVGEPGVQLSPTAGAGTSAPSYTLVSGTSFPPHAVALRLRFTTGVTLGAGTTVSARRTYLVQDPVSAATQFTRYWEAPATSPAGGSFSLIDEVDVPVSPNLPVGGIGTWFAGASYVVAGATFGSQTVQVVGWKLAR